jgi:hypothetical protein
VTLQVPVAGSYNSALSPPTTTNPTTNTLPLPSSVAVCPDRGTLRLPVGIQLGLTCASATGSNANVATPTKPTSARMDVEWCFLSFS